jgi:hypothetical protein
MKQLVKLIMCFSVFPTYATFCIELQILMNVPPTIHAETVVPVTTQLVHTVAFAQVDGQA